MKWIEETFCRQYAFRSYFVLSEKKVVKLDDRSEEEAPHAPCTRDEWWGGRAGKKSWPKFELVLRGDGADLTDLRRMEGENFVQWIVTHTFALL